METSVRVLLIEDNPGDARLVRESLTGSGERQYELTWVPDLKSGLARIADHPFDAILLDLGLPDSTGITTFEKVRAQAQRTPIILLTGTDDDELAARAVRLGAQDYIVKGEVLDRVLKRVIRYAIERKQAEERFHLVVESAPNAIILADREGGIVMINSQAEKYFGYERSELLGLNIDMLVPPRFREVHPEYRARFHADPRPRPMDGRRELYGIRKNGTEFPVEIGLTPIETLEGSLVMATIVDITERKQAEDTLRENEERFRALIENSSDAITLVDIDGTVLYDSPTAERILGYAHAELVGRNAFDLVHPDDLEGLASRFSNLTNTQVSTQATFRYRHKDGSWRWVEAVGTNLLESPAVGAIVINYHDIGERRRAEEKIHRQIAHLTALREIDRAITSNFGLQSNLDTLVEHALAQLAADAVSILLLDPEQEVLRYSVGRGFRTRAFEKGNPLHLGEGYAGRAALEQKLVHVDRLPSRDDNPRLARHLEAEEFVSYFGVPLIAKGKVKGVLEVFMRTAAEPEQEWLDFLETLAGQAAIAVDNAQLWEQVQRHARELEQRVEERTAELQHANRAKDEFLANMSHELRTPLNSILGMSEMLLEQIRDPLTEHQQKSLKLIESSGSHLLNLINDILDISKLEAGRADFHPEMVEIDEICQSSLTFVRNQAIKKQINLAYEADPHATMTQANPRRLKQILVNLLTNAVKFTPEHGQVRLQVQADPDQGLIRFSVVDTGLGISEEDLKRLFQPFVQVDSSLNRRQEGTGLGLALVRKLTDLHGGSVHVESEVGKGSRFTVILPWGRAVPESPESLVAGSQNAAEKESRGPREGIPKRGTVLLAEDNLPNILTIGEYLKEHGYTVVIAHDGVEALDLAQKNDPDIILMDIQMPVMDGLEATRRLRANPQFASTPIIALTALAMPGDRERCLEAGANEYMSKPVRLKSLLTMMETLLQQREGGSHEDQGSAD